LFLYIQSDYEIDWRSMTLEQLRIFVAVAEREHMTEAARHLHLTQSAVSGAIAALERQHAVRLFDRVGRSVALNQIGRDFLVEARGVLSRAAAAEAVLSDLSGLRRGRLAIHATPTIASYWLPTRLVTFKDAYPGVELQVIIGNTDEVTQAVVEGRSELGFVGVIRPEVALASQPVGFDQLLLLVRPDHPWSDRRPLKAADFQAGTWVLREPGSGVRASFDQALRRAGLLPSDLNVSMTLPSNEAVLAAAEAGAGATALSESVAAPALAIGSLVRASFVLPVREYFVLRHKERYRSQAGDAFLQTCLGGRVEPRSIA
jgi:DNA-binding transcriptional LysR family regulator